MASPAVAPPTYVTEPGPRRPDAPLSSLLRHFLARPAAVARSVRGRGGTMQLGELGGGATTDEATTSFS